MNIETHNFETNQQDISLEKLSTETSMQESKELNSSLAEIENNSQIYDNQHTEMLNFTGKINSAQLAYGLHKLSELPKVKEVIDGYKTSISENITKFEDNVKEFLSNFYDDVKSFFSHNDSDAKAIENLGDNFVEQRDFGLNECTKAAKEIFNPGIINNWANLSLEQRKEISGVYANEVAQAFELKNYTGVYFEDLEDGVMGYNNGDGSIHLSNQLITAWSSPLEILNTITHELRHQYQFESVQGLHNVSEDVVKEWATAQEIYNYDRPYCYDPWGYTYNPLEIDARYAGETVVRNLTHDMINA